MSSGACSVSTSTQSGLASARISVTTPDPAWLQRPICGVRAAIARLKVLVGSSMNEDSASAHRRIIGRRQKDGVHLLDELPVLLRVRLHRDPLRILAEVVPRLFA